jgi:hypothetical protein
MFPTIAQYRKWSLPAKCSFWGFILALVPIAISVRDSIIAVPDYAVLAFNYGTSEMTIFGGAGDSPETAVIIRGANSHEAGVKAESYWIRRRYPGYESLFQAVFDGHEPGPPPPRTILKDSATGAEVEMVQPANLAPRRYDVLTIRNWYRRTREVYFDITTFMGKPSEPRPGGISEDEAYRQSAERLHDAIKRKKQERHDSGEKAK